MSQIQPIRCHLCQQTPCLTRCAEHDDTLNQYAAEYVKLVLAIGHHEPLYVDAYYGPAKWQAEASMLSLPELASRCALLVNQLANVGQDQPCQLLRERHGFLSKQLGSVATYLKRLMGHAFSFDAESRLLYDTQAPKLNLSDFSEVLARIDSLLPGEGTLTKRFDAYRSQFIVPADRVPQVFTAAVEQARLLTKRHLTLPEGEQFRVEFVKDKIWTAYNWYQGNYASLIQLNQDHPLHLERALELASHEGYPGHHVFNLLQERELVKGLGWWEYAIYPLYSPISFLSEGSANYGLSLLMTKEERFDFEQRVLMPMAGIAGDLQHYHEVMEAYKALANLDTLVCRQLIDGEITREEASQLLVEFALYTPEKAAQRVRFYQANRSYVLNYHHGEASVGEYVTNQARDNSQAWEVFAALLARPRAASEIIR
ncbi:hypothetical protein [Shewanella aegiceratis]|uniref:hypothetical protein n=1 Tax=Shewanella aegiceratis TaxID=2864203 RepID=UPI0021AC54F3|nr:hypothetical protein [Shewanella aegiceratis]